MLHTTKNTIEEIEEELGNNPAESKVEAHKKEIYRKINDAETSDNRRKVRRELECDIGDMKRGIRNIRDILNKYEGRNLSDCSIEITDQLENMIIELFDIENNLERFI
jgi:molecular chaperone GrpE (heat shock protein)